MIWKTSWKNVWRNRVRSLVVIASVTIGIFGGVFAVAVMNGAIQQRLDAALNEELAHIHVNRPGFRDNYDMRLTIPRAEKTGEMIRETAGVEAVAARLLVTGMAGTASRSTGVQILGVDPEDEKEVFRLHERTVPGTGDFFGSDSRYNLAYIGEDLAKELKIIRYRIDGKILDSLRTAQLPGEVIDKLSPLTEMRYMSEKPFRKELESLLGKDDLQKHGRTLMKAAWSFRERSRMTLTFLDSDQVQTGAVFRIAGIYDIRNNMFEMSRVFVKKDVLAGLTGMEEGAAHQLIIRVREPDNAGAVASRLSDRMEELEVMSWKKIQPDLAMTTGMVQKFYAVFMVIILAALAFGIVNTMLMVVLERTKELGMLTAIGMNKMRVFGMIMLESIFLSMVGGIVGMVVSRILILVTAANGINLSGYQEGFEAIGFSSHIYPTISPGFFFLVTVLIILTGILSSIYPALKALKLDPAEALRTE